VRIFLVTLAVPALVRLKLSTLEWVLEPRPAPSFQNAETVQRTIQLVESVLHVSRPFLRPTCLTRGVTLHYFLRRLGVNARLIFGIGHPNGKVAGHCWLEVDGEPFLERDDPRPVFVETYRIPSALVRA
jgi:hypothetical protein